MLTGVGWGCVLLSDWYLPGARTMRAYRLTSARFPPKKSSRKNVSHTRTHPHHLHPAVVPHVTPSLILPVRTIGDKTLTIDLTCHAWFIRACLPYFQKS